MSTSSWMNNPLIWTTLVAILIAAIATVAIAVLMVIFRQRKEVRYATVEQSASSRDSSSSTLTDQTQGSVTEPDLLVYESEKKGKYQQRFSESSEFIEIFVQFSDFNIYILIENRLETE